MKTLLSLTMVLAFFVAIPQCFGQDADQSPAQLFTEQQPLQMSLLVMAPPPSCHQTVCNPALKEIACDPKGNSVSAKACRDARQICRQECNIECHAGPVVGEECNADGTAMCHPVTGDFSCERP